MRDEFEGMGGLETLWTVTNDAKSGLYHERIDNTFLKQHISDFSQQFYLCGPDDMVKDLRAALEELGANVDALVWEK
ncbi:hypothetical protein PSQ19_15845 [Devosia algicola]|uniref:Oxidoreductase FAD/NAD(P)-binding domain-containing protein n=1 Tax=Devosia algicola TaxID=3026418 RepID=A0ABY7YLN4_9HYPH|nr:hypothetical protein [Devosia algicola]WDR02119.1 hypothetical protein PSQ19_15845 [Devosia algicola]